MNASDSPGAEAPARSVPRRIGNYDQQTNLYHCVKCDAAIGEHPAATPALYVPPRECSRCYAARPRAPFGVERAREIWAGRGFACDLRMSEAEEQCLKDVSDAHDCERLIYAFFLILHGKVEPPQ